MNSSRSQIICLLLGLSVLITLHFRLLHYSSRQDLANSSILSNQLPLLVEQVDVSKDDDDTSNEDDQNDGLQILDDDTEEAKEEREKHHLDFIKFNNISKLFPDNNDDMFDDKVPDIGLNLDNPYDHYVVNPQTNETKRAIVFVHVGKAGGSSMRCHLKYNFFEALCYAKKHRGGLDRKPSAISDQVVELVHKHARNVGNGASLWGDLDGHKSLMEVVVKERDSFIVASRDPIERMISWFNYEPFRDKSMFWSKHLKFLKKQCKYTLETLATKGLDPSRRTLGDKCIQEAWLCVQGKVPCKFHNTYNYEYYLKHLLEVKQDKEIFVIRNENKWDDWNKVNLMIGGNESQNIQSDLRMRVSGPNKSNSKELSEQGRMNLCYALCKEINYYIELLNAAENLDESDVNESMRTLNQSCGGKDVKDVCKDEWKG